MWVRGAFLTIGHIVFYSLFSVGCLQVGSVEENELILTAVLDALHETLLILLRGQVDQSIPDLEISFFSQQKKDASVGGSHIGMAISLTKGSFLVIECLQHFIGSAVSSLMMEYSDPSHRIRLRTPLLLSKAES